MILATQTACSDIISALMDANADANITEKVSSMINIATALISMNSKDLVSETYWVIIELAMLKIQAPSFYYFIIGYCLCTDRWLECNIFWGKVRESQHSPAVDFWRSFGRTQG